ncbi:hypothetical protein [Solimonas terrae]|uniref:Multidrug transporter n=1 Tax=Solimonas terrae TaxID=1396819 RepID=A0A6M2BU58_9GAMM|nr:hypothetical protein [Solimonas terrae]NGY05519.1 hypothetical protein [Solimonas terrae]
MSRLHSFTVAAVLAMTIGSAHAQVTQDVDTSPSAVAMAADLLIVRPLGLVATVLGTGLFVLQLPLSVVQGEPPADPARKLIVAPAQFTFSRPLGDLE